MASLFEIRTLARTAVFLTALLFILTVAARPSFAQEVRYNYDAAGRLISVTDEQGRNITYDYDALGNLLGVRRQDTVGQVAINLVIPDSGFVGTQVEIIGKGFSNVLNENAIAFNGVSAPVLAASTTSLTTQVPIGASTGPITVKTPSGSATSPQPFTVLVATVNVSPVQATLVRGTTQQFTATIIGPSDTRVIWSVDGIVGGNATVGTITPDGLYNAPSPSTTATSSLVVTIRATSVAVPGLSATASVTVLATCTIFWTGAGGNNLWQNSANWNTKVLPGVNDDTCIGVGFNVTLSSGTQTIRSLNSDSALSISSGILSLAAASTLTHNFSLNGGSLGGAGSFTVFGQSTWTSGTMTGAGTTTLNGNLSISGNAFHDLTAGRVLNTNATTMMLGAAGNDFLRMGGGAVINNFGLWLDQSTVTVGISSAFGGAPPSFLNAGTFRKSGGSAATTIGVAFNNTSGGAETGVVEVLTGTLNFHGGGTANNGSSLTGAAGTTLGFAGNHALQVGSSLSGSTITFTGGTINLNGSYSASTATSMIGGTANFNPGATVTSVGALTIGSGSGGTANFSSGDLITAASLSLPSIGTLEGTDAVTVTGQTTWVGGTMRGTGVTTLNGNVTITGNNFHDLFGGRTLNTAGTTTMSGGFNDFFRTNGGASINNSGLWLDQSSFNYGITGTQSTFRNTGTYRKTGTGTTTIAIAFNNLTPGVVDLQAGTLNLTGGGTQTGDFIAQTGATLLYSGGTYDLNDGSVASLRITTGTVNIAGTFTIDGPLELSGGTLRINGQVSANSYSQSFSTLRGTGTLTVAGPATWTSGTMTDAGTTTFNGSLAITGNVGNNSHDLTGGRILNTTGTTTLTGGFGGFIRMANGTRINNSGLWLDQSTSFLDIMPFFGAQATFHNTGTYRKSSATTTIGIIFNNASTGIVDIQTGTLQFSGGGTANNGSTFTGAAATTLGFSGGTYDLSGGSIVSAATVAFTGGTTNINGNYSATATTISGISTANFNPGAAVTAIGALTILTGTASFSTGGLIGATALTLGSGGLAGTLAGTDAVTVSGQAIWTAGTMTGTGVTTLNGNFTLTGAVGNLPHDLTGGRTLNTTGTTTVTGGFSDFIRMANATGINNSGLWLDQSTSFLGITLLGGGAQATFRNTGTYRKSGAATTTVAVAFNNISPGVVEVQTGTLTLNGGGTETGTFATTAGATFQFNGGTFNLDNVSMGSLRVTTGTVNISGTSTIGGLLELSGATLVINGQVTANSYSQSLATLRGTGTLTVTGPATWASGAMADAGTTTFNGNLSIPNVAGTTHDISGGRVLNTNGTTSMTGGLNDFIRMQNGTTINNSGLWLDQAAIFAQIIPFSGAPIFNNSGTYRKTGGDTTTIGLAFNNTGTVEVQAGTLRFTGVYTQTAGNTTLNGGTLASTNALNLPTTLNIQGGSLGGIGTVTANVVNAGQVSPGASSGILNISGSYTQTAAGVLNIEIGGLTAGTEFDRLIITGSTTLNGTLTISLIGGFVPGAGNTFQVMTFGSRSGTFTTINGLDLGSGRSLQVQYNATNVTLVTPP
jgi:YD repeat-containing protein